MSTGIEKLGLYINDVSVRYTWGIKMCLQIPLEETTPLSPKYVFGMNEWIPIRNSNRYLKKCSNTFKI